MKTTLLAVAVLSGLVLFPSSASAAVCSDFPSQAAAQAAANTVDADGDGIYCESLPCPCSTKGGAPPPPPPVAPPPPPATPLPPPALTSGTQRLIYSPFAPDGSLASGLIAVSRTGDCWIGSEKAIGAYRCTAGDQIHDPCYATPAETDSVVCAPAPWIKTVVRIRLTDSLPEPATSRGVPRVWALQLVSGNRRCSWLSGGTRLVRGMRLNYACGGNRVLFGSPRTTTPFWKIRLSHGVRGRSMRFVAIKRAWR